MLKHMIKRFLHSVKGQHQQRHYSSSDYKYSKHRGPHSQHNHQYPPPPQHFGHKHYKRKYKSFSSYFSS
ncbi:hypothetical protein [Paenibacillus sp. 1001270B_150601_E10]|uniref:hypothetical protein n=1 Tax=Paenibacillus sp. 1001270B_150601_E10 TaxID=2787079 RepID=UPI00189DF9DC|nr:hypothetical protein [Paenibacillus sp. 1001270B_150601_E10]